MSLDHGSAFIFLLEFVITVFSSLLADFSFAFLLAVFGLDYDGAFFLFFVVEFGLAVDLSLLANFFLV